MSTAELHLNTLFVFDDDGRITSTREPGVRRGPLFSLVRSATSRAWAARSDLPQEMARELDLLASEEPPAADLHEAPLHAERYESLLAGLIASGRRPRLYFGPAFAFPEISAETADVVTIHEEKLLQPHFGGWTPGEIAAGRGPVIAAIENGHPVSICFCARSSDAAAEAGLETAETYRGRGLGPRVAAAWAKAIRASGRVPLYSTAWSNAASLAVARKLGLEPYACGWSLSDG